MWTLPWQALWQLPQHIITAQAVAVGCVWCSWWQFSTFQCRIASLWIIWLRGYCDMDRIDIGIEMWYQYRCQYRKICNAGLGPNTYSYLYLYSNICICICICIWKIPNWRICICICIWTMYLNVFEKYFSNTAPILKEFR